jgi:hypothetical protein
MTIAQRAIVLLLLYPWIAVMASEGLRPFEVHDSIEMAYFGTRLSSAPDDLDEDGLFSPDGRHFIKITHRGLLPQGVMEGTLWLFDAAAVERSVEDPTAPVSTPVPLVQMAPAVNGGLGLYVLDAGNTLSAPHWSADGHALHFWVAMGAPTTKCLHSI